MTEINKKEMCIHSSAVKTDLQFYCPDCHLCMELEYTEGGAKQGRAWYEIQPHLI